MAASESCKAPNCRRRVSSNYEFYPYCYDHKDISRQSNKATGSLAEDNQSAQQVNRPIPAGGSGTVYHTSEIISKAYGISRKDSYAIVLANQQTEEQFGDLTIPENADRIPLHKYLEKMIENGIDSDRVKVVEYRGYNAYNESSQEYLDRIARAPGASKKVISMDSGTENELIIDPSISSLAIARSRSTPIESDQELFPSGRTPFGDSPWVGTEQEYRNGALLFWDSRTDDPTEESR